MKHTPGPWKAEQYGSTDDGRNIFSIEAPSGMVCESAFEADARLIAAAPKMAKALEYISRRLKADIDDGSRPDQWSMEDMVRTALEALPEGYEEQ
jgi:hypothetical protein